MIKSTISLETNISHNISKIELASARVTQRQNRLLHVIEKLDQVAFAADEDDEELVETVVEYHNSGMNASSDITTYIERLVKELDFLKRGFVDFKALPESEAKQVFGKFILEDTYISLGDIERQCDYLKVGINDLDEVRKELSQID